MNSTDDISKLVPAISSKLRSIPGVANFSRHTTMLMDDKGNVISKNELSRSSHVASRDMKDATLRADITEDNINHIIDNMLKEQATKLAQLNLDRKLSDSPVVLPVLMQTLITPANKTGPDGALLKDRDEAIKRIAKNPEQKFNVDVIIDGKPQTKEITVKLEIFATNHPLNELRYYGAGTGRFAAVFANTDDKDLSTDPNQRDMQRLTRFARRHIKKYISNPEEIAERFPLLHALTEKFNNVAPKMVAEIQDKELYLSSLQQLMAAEMGIAYGSCVSGKDRKGISTIYTDAMRMFYDIYKKLPPPSVGESKERKDFVRLFAEIYVTRHQHENAGQNAKGSDGLKTPVFYLPKDMLIAVMKLTFNKWIHKQCDRLASNNEIGKIVFGKN